MAGFGVPNKSQAACSSGGASRSRAREEPMDADDALSSILGRLDMKAGTTVASDSESAVAVLMEVLCLDHDSAAFYLESASNDVSSKALIVLAPNVCAIYRGSSLVRTTPGRNTVPPVCAGGHSRQPPL